VLTNTVLVKSRTLSSGAWSALNEAIFQVAELGVPLYPTELMFNPPGGDAYEFIELMNTGSVPLDVSGFSFAGLQFAFLPGTVLNPGQVVVLSSDVDPLAFARRYPAVTVLGAYRGGLNNAGERLALIDREGRTVWSLEYSDANGWPFQADGGGASLEVMDPAGDLGDPANWRASANPGGSPSLWTAPSSPSGVRLNEVYAFGGGPAAAVNQSMTSGGEHQLDAMLGTDWLELYNAGVSHISLAGWSLSDDGNARKFVFPSDASLGPASYLVIWCDSQTNTPGFHTGFGLEREGESIFLYDNHTNRIDALTIGLQAPNFSVGRLATGNWQLTTLTPGTANVAAPLASPTNLLINEWLANPVPGQDDWLELFNRATNAPVALQELYLATSNALYRLKSLSFIAPGGFVRLWADAAPGVDHLQLKLPAEGGMIALLDKVGAPLDRVVYGPQVEDIPMGRLPDGQKTIVALGAHTPSRSNSSNPAVSDRDSDGLPDAWELAHGLDQNTGRGVYGPAGDPDQDGLDNGQEYLAGTDPRDASSKLQFTAVHMAADGLHLVFTAVAGKTYAVEFCDSLAKGAWQKLTEISARQSPGAQEIVDRDAAKASTRFYRLVTPARP
jgi:hypothetical protein